MSTPLHKLRVGIVDDDDDSRFLVRYWLEMHGYEVRDWARPKDLLAFLPEDRVDLFLIDIRLPEMDGLSLAHAIKQRHGNSVPLIAVTGYVKPVVRDQAAAAGFARFLTKPVDLNVLIQTIQRILLPRAS
jgi:CheY-like chemotaxis protein